MRFLRAVVITILLALAISTFSVLSIPTSGWTSSLSSTLSEAGTSSDEIRAVVHGDPLSEVVAGYRPSTQHVAMQTSHHEPEHYGSIVEQGGSSQFWSPQAAAPVQLLPKDPFESTYHHFAPAQGFPQPQHQVPQAAGARRLVPLSPKPSGESTYYIFDASHDFQQTQPPRYPGLEPSSVATQMSPDLEHPFMQSLREVHSRFQSADGLNPATPPDPEHLEALAYAHAYEHLNEKPFTLAEREWITHAVRGQPYWGLGHAQTHMVGSASREAAQASHQAGQVVGQAVQEPPMFYLASRPARPASDDADFLQAYKISRGEVLADPDVVLPSREEFTDVQKKVADYQLPYRSLYLKPKETAKFFNIIGKNVGTVRLAADPGLATKMTFVPLSNQKLTADRGLWKRLGMRILFAQNENIAFALVDAQLLKSAFPGMLLEDRQKLLDGTVALIKIEKLKRSYAFRLFSVVNVDFLRSMEYVS
ncbi:conserved hypothetical protein [Sporisorium reilianum SRZ2]|uniref:SCP domain-containing protein n=1 Tax=Sporisorium reilianum (strain SRZ2) TaxID=999809 RepID=E6ZRB3_SPORE|nr:conserved hypothetical protein [Sporisorium reilianum SRZ2]